MASHFQNPWRVLAAALACSCLLRHAQADDAGLPGEWRTGIATNYGGAQDGKARVRSLSCMLQSLAGHTLQARGVICQACSSAGAPRWQSMQWIKACAAHLIQNLPYSQALEQCAGRVTLHYLLRTGSVQSQLWHQRGVHLPNSPLTARSGMPALYTSAHVD